MEKPQVVQWQSKRGSWWGRHDGRELENRCGQRSALAPCAPSSQPLLFSCSPHLLLFPLIILVHYLTTERGSEHRLWIYLHGIGAAFQSQEFGPWQRSRVRALSGDYHRNSVWACVYARLASTMPATDSLGCSGWGGSSWEGVTTSSGVGVSTCSESCCANVAAATSQSEVCTVGALLLETRGLQQLTLREFLFTFVPLNCFSR